MKRTRTFYVVAGITALLVLLAIGCFFEWRSLRDAEESRIKTMQKKLVDQIIDYRHIQGMFPDSLQMFAPTNQPQELQTVSDIRKMAYKASDGGFVLEYDGMARSTWVVFTPWAK